MCGVVARMPQTAAGMATNMRSIMERGNKDMERFRKDRKDRVDVFELPDLAQSTLLYQPFLTGENLLSFGRQLLRFRSHDVATVLSRLGSQGLPALLVTGAFDTTTSTERARAACAKLAGSLTEKELPTASHYMICQDDSTLVELLNEFIGSL
jgi:pimeloyl-ACP methyl ester carboxylesterase